MALPKTTQLKGKTMRMRAVALFVAVMGIVLVSAVARMQAPGDTKVYFIAPKNGYITRGPVVVRFGLVGMFVAPAGVEKENAGHHHLLIDTGLPKMHEGTPSDPKHLHFGEDETQSTLRFQRSRSATGELVAAFLQDQIDKFASCNPKIAECNVHTVSVNQTARRAIGVHFQCCRRS
jgi:hypothetical protein